MAAVMGAAVAWVACGTGPKNDLGLFYQGPDTVVVRVDSSRSDLRFDLTAVDATGRQSTQKSYTKYHLETPDTALVAVNGRTLIGRRPGMDSVRAVDDGGSGSVSPWVKVRVLP